MRHGTSLWLLAGCVALAGCSVVSDADVPDGDGTASRGPDGSHGPCVSYYADSDEIAGRGQLVQLDIMLRYGATRSVRTGGDGVSMVLDAESRVEGSASQLACAWDTVEGGVRYELVRTDGEESQPFTSTHTGSAQLAGSRVTQADGATIREEVDMTGPLESLRVKSLGPWEGAGTEACVVLSFDAPLRGRSLLRATAPGLQREESMDPSGLVLDGYSALSPRTYDGGDHRFLDQSFAICPGQESDAPGHHGPPRGLTVSDDGRLWQRSGSWQRHPSGPVEQRTVDFTLRVVPPVLRHD